MGNRFEKIKEHIVLDIVNAGKDNGELDSRASTTILPLHENKGITEAENTEIEEQKSTGINEENSIRVNGEKNKKLKRSFMLTSKQIQMLSKLKMEHFVKTCRQVDLSDLVGNAIEDYFNKMNTGGFDT